MQREHVPRCAGPGVMLAKPFRANNIGKLRMPCLEMLQCVSTCFSNYGHLEVQGAMWGIRV